MKPLERADLLDIAEYEKVREDRLQAVIRLKKRRRLAIGPMVTLLFENRETIRSQIQEMMRAERLVKDAAIDEELAVYNELIPASNELSATLFIEVDEPARVREVLDRFIGLDEAGRVFLRLDSGLRVAAQFEAGRSREDRISAVHFVKFPLGEAGARAWKGGGRVEAVIEHPNYEACAEIEGDLRQALSQDLA